MSDSEMGEEDSWGSLGFVHEAQDIWDSQVCGSQGGSEAKAMSDCGEMEVDDAEFEDGMKFGPPRIRFFTGTHLKYDDEGNLIRPGADGGQELEGGGTTSMSGEDGGEEPADEDGTPIVYRNQEQASWYDRAVEESERLVAEAAAAEAAAAAVQRPNAWLEFCGTTPNAGLPPRIELEGRSIVVGRVDGGLDSAVQPEMVSRYHLELTYTPLDATWALRNKSAVNGTLLQRVGEAQSRRVQEGPVGDGDIITFGGARSTEVGQTPGERAPKSIYVYMFHSAPAPGSGV
jgi:hypothetical protein